MRIHTHGSCCISAGQHRSMWCKTKGRRGETGGQGLVLVGGDCRRWGSESVCFVKLSQRVHGLGVGVRTSTIDVCGMSTWHRLCPWSWGGEECGKGDKPQRQRLGWGWGVCVCARCRPEGSWVSAWGQYKPRSPATAAQGTPRPLLLHLYNGCSRAQTPRVES